MKSIQNVTLVAIAVATLMIGISSLMHGGDTAMANRESITRDLMNLAFRAQGYYHRPISKGGGGGTFAGLAATQAGFRKLASKETNANGTYWIAVAGNATNVTIHCSGTAFGNNGAAISVDIKVMPDSTYVTYNN